MGSPTNGLPGQDKDCGVEKKEFVEIFDVLFETVGVPRVAGRIRGWLPVCDAPHQIAAELADAIRASRASISTMTRLLTQFGLMERIGLSGERNRFYRIKSGGSTELLKARMSLTTEVCKTAERGLEMLKDKTPGRAADARSVGTFTLSSRRSFRPS
jgi:DNA-binding transcriptional regulator GbsR (MarR family)